MKCAKFLIVIGIGSTVIATSEFWQYTQDGDPALCGSSVCAQQSSDFSFKHLLCLSQRPYRDSFNARVIDELAYIVPLYNAILSKRHVELPSKFAPYLRKLIMASDAQAFVWGDLHGAALSLFKALENLYDRGIIDDDFRVTAPHTYLIFLGDIHDRGYRNILTLYTVLRLAQENPERVIILRGNHETSKSLAHTDMTLKDEFQVYHPAEDLLVKVDSELALFYERLPVGFFLGNRLPDGSIDYLALNHGAVELGLDARDFLAEPTMQYYDVTLDRSRAIETIVPSEKKAFFERFANLKQENARGFGLTWSDFCTEQQYFDLPESSARACYGKDITRRILAYQTRDLPNIKISSIIRGHQHSLVDLGTTLAINQGALSSWDGLVYTVNASGELFCKSKNPRVVAQTSFSSWLHITPTTDPAQPWDIKQEKLVHTPTTGWQFSCVTPAGAPLRTVDLCTAC